MDDELLSIGRFAQLCGLSIGALRHYDEQAVLRPADVDPSTGYRRYRRHQLEAARAIAALRALDLSLPAIRALLGTDDPTTRAAILREERLRLEARTARMQRALHRLTVLSASRAPIEEMPVSHTTSTTLEPDLHRSLGAGLFNRAWDLLEIEHRSPVQDDDLIDTAHASAWHWRQVGNAANEARGHWLCSRVYAVLGRGEPAVHHARRAVAIAEAGGEGLEDWDGAAAAEAMARALAVSGDQAGAGEWKARAAAALDAIDDPEDRRVIAADLETLPI